MHSLIQPSQPGRHWKVQPDKCCPFCQLASKGSEVDNNWQLDCAIANNVGGASDHRGHQKSPTGQREKGSHKNDQM